MLQRMTGLMRPCWMQQGVRDLYWLFLQTCDEPA